MTGAVFVPPHSGERQRHTKTEVELTPSVLPAAPEALAAGDALARPFGAPPTSEEAPDRSSPGRD